MIAKNNHDQFSIKTDYIRSIKRLYNSLLKCDRCVIDNTIDQSLVTCITSLSHVFRYLLKYVDYFENKHHYIHSPLT